jgi:hypothetical protein
MRLAGHRRQHRGIVTHGRVDLGEAEVEELGRPALRHEDVCRLDVAMNDAGPVRCVERVRDVGGHDEQVGDRQRACAHLVL